ncbi:hypothetical protein [Shewanella acanthi]|uniref:hypothetical protein n=1 Tax=Shewanella acanthi TaxID=2864212 RepID=UPI00331427B1
MLNWITRSWGAYNRWCDKMGLTPENRRCCMPRLEDPPLASKVSKLSFTNAEHSPRVLSNDTKGEANKN